MIGSCILQYVGIEQKTEFIIERQAIDLESERRVFTAGVL